MNNDVRLIPCVTILLEKFFHDTHCHIQIPFLIYTLPAIIARGMVTGLYGNSYEYQKKIHVYFQEEKTA